MKPLDLTIFECHECGDTRCFVIEHDKRLTDAELAAEYWRLRLKVCASGNRDMKAKGHVCIEWQTAHDELDAMQRFMDLPHYDDPTETGSTR